MSSSLTRDQQTEELLERFRARRVRRRQLRLFLGTAGVLVMIALVAGGFWVTAGPGTPATTAGAKTAASPGPAFTAQPTHTSEPAALSQSATTLKPMSTVPPTSPPTSVTSSVDTTPTTLRPPIVVIDPGHQASPDYSKEPVGPGATTNKAKVSTGTAGTATGIPEGELVLAVGLKLRDSLQKHGVKVVMTRTAQEVNISNIQRAQIANEAQADIFVRIHADGSENPEVKGIHVLYPASIKGWTDDIAKASKQAAALVQSELIAVTGAVDLGIQTREDITGFNWSDVPVVLAEIGFMTNPEEDRLLATPSYQDKIVQGLAQAILAFLGVS